jgi:hypothetical protein
MKKSVFILVMVVVLVAALVLALSDGSGSIDDIITTPDFDSTEDGLSQAMCESTGGTWNACGSACRQDPDAICIEVCVEYCECDSDDQCPDSLTCSDYVDDVGVCL